MWLTAPQPPSHLPSFRPLASFLSLRPSMSPLATRPLSPPPPLSLPYQVIPADLNAFLYQMELNIAWAAALAGGEGPEGPTVRRFRDAAAQRKAAMDALLWDEAAGGLNEFFLGGGLCQGWRHCCIKCHGGGGGLDATDIKCRTYMSCQARTLTQSINKNDQSSLPFLPACSSAAHHKHPHQPCELIW